MEYQKCPICNGSGLVSGGFYIHAGDCNTWISDHAAETCRQCQGTGLIVKPEMENKMYDEAYIKEITK